MLRSPCACLSFSIVLMTRSKRNSEISQELDGAKHIKLDSSLQPASYEAVGDKEMQHQPSKSSQQPKPEPSIEDRHASVAEGQKMVEVKSHTISFEMPILRFQIPAYRYSTKHTRTELEHLVPDAYWLSDSQHDVLCSCESCLLVWDRDL